MHYLYEHPVKITWKSYKVTAHVAQEGDNDGGGSLELNERLSQKGNMLFSNLIPVVLLLVVKQKKMKKFTTSLL